jgi:hypothetical protein
MRLPEDRENSADLLQLICDLIEAPRARIGANFLNARTSDVERLVTFGLVRRGSAPRTIACRACDEDHAATPEFDSVVGRYFHFCPVVGRVEIEPHEMETVEICARAMVDLLVAAFPVLPAIGQELVAGKAWHLGEAVVGRTSLTLIFACRVGHQRTFGALARAVAAVPVTEIGMIVTSSPLRDLQLVLPNRYAIIGLRDIATVNADGLAISRNRVAAHIRMRRENPVRLRASGGRPSAESLVVDAHNRLCQRGELFRSIAAEAQAIVSELAVTDPDRAALGVSTVRRHLSKLRRSRP